MTRIVIEYSIPLFNKGELLNGGLSNSVLGYRHVSVTIQAHVTEADLPEALEHAVPEGYYLVEHPQIAQDPPKVGLFQLVTTGEKYSNLPNEWVIDRPLGEPAYTG